MNITPETSLILAIAVIATALTTYSCMSLIDRHQKWLEDKKLKGISEYLALFAGLVVFILIVNILKYFSWLG